MLVRLETDLLNETLHAGVLRRDILAHAGIVGVLDVTEMSELQHDIRDACQEDENDDRIIDIGLNFSLFHSAYNVWVVYLS